MAQVIERDDVRNDADTLETEVDIMQQLIVRSQQAVSRVDALINTLRVRYGISASDPAKVAEEES
jgi:hypothetical protein